MVILRMATLLFLLMPTAGTCCAQESPLYLRCMRQATTQTAMNACANEEVQQTQAELDETLQRLVNAASGDAGAVEKIRSMEKAWIAYRDAYIEAKYPTKEKRHEYGSILPMEADLLRARLTRQQIMALNELLAQYRRELI